MEWVILYVVLVAVAGGLLGWSEAISPSSGERIRYVFVWCVLFPPAAICSLVGNIARLKVLALMERQAAKKDTQT